MVNKIIYQAAARKPFTANICIVIVTFQLVTLQLNYLSVLVAIQVLYPQETPQPSPKKTNTSKNNNNKKFNEIQFRPTGLKITEHTEFK
jgi:hypothetical protein